jgi:hypothetical protein
MVSILAPSIYFGTLPPKQAEAQIAGAAACMLGALMGGLLNDMLAFFGIGGSVAIATTVPEVAGTAILTAAGLAQSVPVEAMANQAVVPTSESNIALANLINLGVEANWTNAITLSSIAVSSGAAGAAGTEAAAATKSFTFKECVLDPLAWAVKTALIDMITQSLLEWIRGGFHGMPAFLDDPYEFFGRLGDAVVDNFLWRSGLDEILCSPFSIQILLDFEMNFYRNTNYRHGMTCGLGGIFSRGLFSGIDVGLAIDTGYERVAVNGDIDFDGGGFDAVFGMLEDQNNGYGSYYNLESQALAQRDAITYENRQLIVSAKGYMSLKCDMDNDGKMDKICTPGSFIVDKVDDATNTYLSQLEIADELAEIVDALLSTLVQELLSSFNQDGGLLGGGRGGAPDGQGGTVDWWQDRRGAVDADPGQWQR